MNDKSKKVSKTPPFQQKERNYPSNENSQRAGQGSSGKVPTYSNGAFAQISKKK